MATPNLLNPEATQTEPDPRRWLVLAVTSLGGFLGALMFTSVNVALPSMLRSLDTEFNSVQWVVLSYLLATGTLLPIVGRLADMLGKRILYMSGYLVFTLGCLLSGLAPDVVTLIAARAVQGVGGAFLTALGIAIITDIFPTSERGRAIGISGSVLSVGIVAGPTLGGLLIEAFSWRWIFLLAFPIGLLGAILAQRFLPHYERTESGRFDVWGALLLFLGLLSLLLGLTFGQNVGFSSPIILGLFTGSAALLGTFVWLELHTQDPIIDLRLFKNAGLSIGLITGFTTFISISAVIFLIPFYLSNVLGYSAREVGLLLSINPILLVFSAPIAGAVADKIGERPVTIFGMISLLIGYILLGGLSEDTTTLGYLLRFFPIGLGMGVFQTPNNSAIMGSVPKERSGVAGGLLALTRTLGNTSGIAILGTVWAVSVLRRAPDTLEATAAPAAAQVASLGEMFFIIQIMIGLGLLLVLWDAWRRRLAGRA